MPDRKFFENSVVPLPDHVGLTERGLMIANAASEVKTEPMTLLFSLEPPEAQKVLEDQVAAGQVVPLDEQNNRYAVDPAEVSQLESWLTNEGFRITGVAPGGAGIYAQGSADQIEKSLSVKMVRVTQNGVTYTSAQNVPSLPADVGEKVQEILGLQPFRQAHKHLRKGVPKTLRTAGVNIANQPPYLVPEILKAYNADGLGLSGSGQTIAILIDTFPSDSDLTAFWQRNGVPVTLQRIQKINVSGGTLPAPEGEETLDVEWASGIAPGANIRVYATGSLSFVDLDQALDRILADLPGIPGMRQLSISLGLGEKFMAKGEVTTQHSKLLRLAAAGVNVFVSSGDAGSNPDQTGHSPTGPTQAEYESSDTAVIGVGGTSLTLAADGSVSSETGWVASGGGVSVFFPRPVWQQGAGVPAGSMRTVPDVSMAADPNRGAFLFLHGQPQQIGGTSWSAPVWAGFCALMNEAREKAGKPFLPFLNPSLYPLLGSPSFRDIVSGSNGAFSAGPGYDMLTGIGVPNVKELVTALA